MIAYNKIEEAIFDNYNFSLIPQELFSPPNQNEQIKGYIKKTIKPTYHALNCAPQLTLNAEVGFVFPDEDTFLAFIHNGELERIFSFKEFKVNECEEFYNDKLSGFRFQLETKI